MENRGTRTPLLWAMLTCAIAAVTALIAYSIGASGGAGETGAAAKPPPVAAPRLVPVAGIYARALKEGSLQGRDRAYRAGRREGLAEARRALDRAGLRELRPGGFYLIRAGPGPSIARRAPIAPGSDYSICPDRKAICERPGRGR